MILSKLIFCMFSVKFRGPLEDDMKQGQVKCNFELMLRFLFINFKRLIWSFQDNFEALQKLLDWSWTSFNTAVLETDGLKGNNLGAALADIQRLVYITRACLRLIKTYVTQIYPNGGTDSRLCRFQTSKSLLNYIITVQQQRQKLISQTRWWNINIPHP